MASQYPPKKNDTGGYTFYVSLVSQADVKLMQANPTIAAGDVKIAKDDGVPVNLATLPVVDADFTKRVKVVLSQAETNADNFTIIFSDAAGAEWCDLTMNFQTVAVRFDAISAAVWAEILHGSKTAKQIVGIWLPAFAAAKLTGGETTTITIRDTEDGFNAIVMTVDSKGNRSQVILNVS